MRKATVSGFIVLLLAAAPAFAATINVGTHDLQPQMADQEIPIYVTGGTPVERTAGMVLFAQIGEGGPEAGEPIADDGPDFMPNPGGADMVTGTIWEVDPAGGSPDRILPQVMTGSVTINTEGSHVDAHGLLCTLMVSTVGFDVGDGPWELKLTDTLDVPTELLKSELIPGSDPPTYRTVALPGVHINNGLIRIVPEPATIVMLLGVLASVPLAFVWGKRKKRAK